MTDHFIYIETNDHPIPLKRGYNLLSNLMLNDIQTQSKCGGKAICGQCRVQILQNQPCSPPTQEELVILSESERSNGWRLACQTFCVNSITVHIPTINELNELIKNT